MLGVAPDAARLSGCKAGRADRVLPAAATAPQTQAAATDRRPSARPHWRCPRPQADQAPTSPRGLCRGPAVRVALAREVGDVAASVDRGDGEDEGPIRPAHAGRAARTRASGAH